MKSKILCFLIRKLTSILTKNKEFEYFYLVKSRKSVFIYLKAKELKQATITKKEVIIF